MIFEDLVYQFLRNIPAQAILNQLSDFLFERDATQHIVSHIQLRSKNLKIRATIDIEHCLA